MIIKGLNIIFFLCIVNIKCALANFTEEEMVALENEVSAIFEEELDSLDISNVDYIKNIKTNNALVHLPRIKKKYPNFYVQITEIPSRKPATTRNTKSTTKSSAKKQTTSSKGCGCGCSGGSCGKPAKSKPVPKCSTKGSCCSGGSCRPQSKPKPKPASCCSKGGCCSKPVSKCSGGRCSTTKTSRCSVARCGPKSCKGGSCSYPGRGRTCCNSSSDSYSESETSSSSNSSSSCSCGCCDSSSSSCSTSDCSDSSCCGCGSCSCSSSESDDSESSDYCTCRKSFPLDNNSDLTGDFYFDEGDNKVHRLKRSTSERDIDELLKENFDTHTVKAFEDLHGDLYQSKAEKVKLEKELTSLNRERIRINEIYLESDFHKHSPVLEWASAGNKAAGHFGKNITLVNIQGNGTLKISEHEFKETITAVFMLEWWNEEEKDLQTILITAEGAQVNWYYYSDNNDLVQFWTWEIEETATGISAFKLGDDALKVLITKREYTDLYKIDPWRKWQIEQRLNGNGSHAVTSDGALLAITTPSAHFVSIYKYNEGKKLYELFDMIHSVDVVNVCTFTSDSVEFMAIGGDDSIIFEVNQDYIRPVEVKHFDFHHIEAFLSIQFDYISNPAVLLVQHKLDHDTHFSSTLEALQWNGIHFELLEHSPCQIEDDNAHGYSCISDHLDTNGIQGAAVLKGGNIKNVITSGYVYSPLMYAINATIEDVPDPRTIYRKHLQDGVNMIQSEFEDLSTRLEDIDAKLELSLKNEIGRRWNINKLVAKSIDFRGNLDAVAKSTINFDIGDKRWTDLRKLLMIKNGELLKLHHQRLKSIVDKLKNAVKIDEEANINLIFKNDVKIKGGLIAKDINVNKINNVEIIKQSDSASNSEINIDKIAAKNLKVTGFINGIDLFNNTKSNVNENLTTAEDFLRSENIDRESRTLPATDDSYHALVIAESVSFKKINGLDWNELLNNILFKTNPIELEKLTVNGDLISSGAASVGNLNGFNYPDSFVDKNEAKVVFKARKTFKNPFTAKSVNCSKTINGVSPDDIVTLKTNQYIGNMTFKKLHVLKTFKVKGSLLGNEIEKMSTNKLLTETNQIDSNVIFNSLHVTGNTYVMGKLNGTTLKKIKSRLLPKNMDPIVVKANKLFEKHVTVDNGIRIQSNKISNIELDSFLNPYECFGANMTLNNVDIKNIFVKGLINDVNVSEVFSNTLTSEGGRVRAAWKFENDTLNVNELYVTDTINDVVIKENVVLKNAQEITLNGGSVFENFETNLTLIHGHLTAPTLNGIDLNELDYYHIYAQNKFKIKNVLSGLYPIHTLQANNVWSKNINDRDLNYILSNAVRIDIPDEVEASLIFLDQINVTDLEVSGLYLDTYFPKFINSLKTAAERKLKDNTKQTNDKI